MTGSWQMESTFKVSFDEQRIDCNRLRADDHLVSCKRLLPEFSCPIFLLSDCVNSLSERP